ncbi:MAG: glycosyltransferase [Phycisphaerae bacterium]|nr:glycosyltransferase [Phycisphaerae bacterium]
MIGRANSVPRDQPMAVFFDNQDEAGISPFGAVVAPTRIMPCASEDISDRQCGGAVRDSSHRTGATRTRRVLFISSRFPPAQSAGVTRVRKFVKYLGDFSWHVTVLTGPVAGRSQGEQTGNVDRGWFATDSCNGPLREIVGGVDGVELKGVKCPIVARSTFGLLEDAGALAYRVADVLSWATRPAGLDRAWWRDCSSWRIESLVGRLTLPDKGIWRLRCAAALALRLHRRLRFDAVFSSGMPFSDHLAALVVRRLIGRPWIADFRDPWVEYAHFAQWRSRWGQLATQFLERRVVCGASRVVVVNDHMGRRFRERYPDQRGRKFVTIENGFDPSDFPASSIDRSAGDEFRLLHAGSLYGARRPDELLKGFRKFLESTADSRRFARLDFLGRVGPNLAQINQFPIDGCVRYLGEVSHPKAVQLMAEADVNIVLLPNVIGGDGDTTAKVYECIGSQRPILAVVPASGSAADVLRRVDGVWFCDPQDADGIASAIRVLYDRWLTGRLLVTRTVESLKPLTRRYQAQRLARELDAIVSQRVPLGGFHR